MLAQEILINFQKICIVLSIKKKVHSGKNLVEKSSCNPSLKIVSFQPFYSTTALRSVHNIPPPFIDCFYYMNIQQNKQPV